MLESQEAKARAKNDSITQHHQPAGRPRHRYSCCSPSAQQQARPGVHSPFSDKPVLTSVHFHAMERSFSRL